NIPAPPSIIISRDSKRLKSVESSTATATFQNTNSSSLVRQKPSLFSNSTLNSNQQLTQLQEQLNEAKGQIEQLKEQIFLEKQRCSQLEIDSVAMKAALEHEMLMHQ